MLIPFETYYLLFFKAAKSYSILLKLGEYFGRNHRLMTLTLNYFSNFILFLQWIGALSRINTEPGSSFFTNHWDIHFSKQMALTLLFNSIGAITSLLCLAASRFSLFSCLYCHRASGLEVTTHILCILGYPSQIHQEKPIPLIRWL